jgi:hypothetical protein
VKFDSGIYSAPGLRGFGLGELGCPLMSNGQAYWSVGWLVLGCLVGRVAGFGVSSGASCRRAEEEQIQAKEAASD